MTLRPWLVWLALLFFPACGQDGFSFGLSGCEDFAAERPFPATAENTVEGGTHTVITAAGTNFLIAQRELIVGALLDVGDDGWVRMALPETRFGGDTVGGGVRDLVVAFDLRTAQIAIDFLPNPTRVRLTLARARLKLEGGVVWVSLGGDAACGLGNGIDVGTADEALVDADIQVDIFLQVDAQSRFQTRIDVLPFNIHALDFELLYDPDLPECSDGISATECRLTCGGGDAAIELLEALYDAFESQLNTMLEPVVESAINGMLGDLSDAPLFVEGDLHPRVIAALVPTAADAHAIGFKVGPSPEGFTLRTAGAQGDGIGLTTDVGLDTVDHPCVPSVAWTPPFEAGPAPALTGYDHLERPYHFGLSLSEAVVNRSLWVAYRSGALCVALDSDQIEATLGQRIDTNSLAIVLPGLRELAGSPRPIMIALDPRFQPEDFPLSTFYSVPEDAGVPQAGLGVSMPNMGLSFYAFIEERWTRLFQANVSLTIDMRVQATPDDRLFLAVDPPVIEDLEVQYNELLEGANVPELLDLVVNLATSALLAEGLSFDVGLGGVLSQATGLPLDLQIAALRVEGEDDDFLSVLMSLTAARSGAGAQVNTTASLVQVIPGEASLRVEALGAPTGARYQWRVDQGPWRTLREARDGALIVRDPLLRALGTHQIEVRAVAIGDYRSLDPTPAEVLATVAAPLRSSPSPEPEPRADVAPDGGCFVSPGGSTHGGPIALALMMLALLGTRRRRLMALAVAALVLGGCEDQKAAATAGCTTTADCPGGLVCFDGLCERPAGCAQTEDCCPGAECRGGACISPDPACADDGDCLAAAQICVAGRCEQRPCEGVCPTSTTCTAGFCSHGPPCGGQCAPEEACYPHLSACRAAPPSCEQSCAPGTVRVVETPQQYTGPQCDLSAATCTCAESPALLPADYGRHASMGVGFDGVVFAAYDADLGDLVLVSGVEEGAPEVQYIDGIPEVAAQADPTGPRGGVTAPGPDRGRYASLVIDFKGRPQIAYYDSDNGALRYVRADDDGRFFAPVMVDDSGDAGRYALVQMDGQNQPHLVYSVVRTADGQTSIRYAHSPQREPEAGDFEVLTISSRPAPAGEAEAPPPGDLPRGHGLMPCMRVGRDGRAYVAFYDGNEGWLYLARGGLGGFDVHRLTATLGANWPADPGGRYAEMDRHDLGRFCDLVVNDEGTMSVAFLDATTNALLLYEGPVEGTGALEVIDPGGRGVRRLVGADPALARDGRGRLVVVYQDATDNDLLLNVRQEDGRWSADPIRVGSEGALGFYNALTLIGDEAVVGTLEMKTTPGGRGAHRLHVFREALPNF